ncbi:HAD-IA family hydrolase [Paenibacillus sp. GSMTC-2017]|uniref:HAD-IA family hydrolase n=1 Tax=Paenibacillus sp. GSMTC-2017 TaxID=2794350 RepID=UPI0018D61355|nr:HAD-IA family hydrolase [Paenibacillus sp. GSMTC-2017]MBH5316547.1 HAD-IA family hydrolase [Paenibacillus sp. GSMTC-2017]
MAQFSKKNRPQIVFDIGGVLATNLSPIFWDRVSEHAKLSKDTLYQNYKENISKKLWRGHLSEAEFWGWLLLQSSEITLEKGQAFLAEALTPLPAIDKIPNWSKSADIHILSNHVSSWVDPILEPIRPYLSNIIISNKVGLSKPHKDVFDYVARLLPKQSVVIFVDDGIKNVQQAELLGWHGILADHDGAWIKEIDKFI